MGDEVKKVSEIAVATTEVINELLKGLWEFLKNRQDKDTRDLLNYQEKGGDLEFIKVDKSVEGELTKALKEANVLNAKFNFHDPTKDKDVSCIMIRAIDKPIFMHVRTKFFIEKGILSEVTNEDMEKAMQNKEVITFNNLEPSMVKTFAELAKEQHICFSQKEDFATKRITVTIPEVHKEIANTVMAGVLLESKFDFYKELNEIRDEDKAVLEHINEKLENRGDNSKDLIIGSLTDYRQSIQIKKDKLIVHSYDDKNNQMLTIYNKEEMKKEIDKFIEQNKPICIIDEKQLKDKAGRTLEDKERLKKLKDIIIPLQKDRKIKVSDKMQEKRDLLLKSINRACDEMRKNIESPGHEKKTNDNLDDLLMEAIDSVNNMTNTVNLEEGKNTGPLFDQEQINRSIDQVTVTKKEVERNEELDEMIKRLDKEAHPISHGFEQAFNKAIDKAKQKMKDKKEQPEKKEEEKETPDER